MKHEEFLKQVKLGATYFKYMNGSPSDGQDDVMKLLTIIEKLKKQRNFHLGMRDNVKPRSVIPTIRESDDKELDEIVMQP